MAPRVPRYARSLIIALVTTVCACGAARTGELAGKRLAPGSTQPTLRIGTSGDYAPFSKAGSGFDIAVAGNMIKDLGYRIEWVTFAWPELGARIKADAF